MMLPITNSHLPNKYAILESKDNERELASMLCSFSSVGENARMGTQWYCRPIFSPDEVDITMISYVAAPLIVICQ